MGDSKKRFGELLVSMGVISEDQNKEILAFNENNPEMMFGEIAVYLGHITQNNLEKYLYLEEVEIGYQNQRNDLSKVENRVECRYKNSIDLQIQQYSKEYKAISVDLSRDGMKFICSHHFQIGSLISISSEKMKLSQYLELTILWINEIEDSDLVRFGGQFSKKLSENDFYDMLRIAKG